MLYHFLFFKKYIQICTIQICTIQICTIQTYTNIYITPNVIISKKYVQTRTIQICTNIYILYLSFIFQKIWYKFVQTYTYCTYCNYFQKIYTSLYKHIHVVPLFYFSKKYIQICTIQICTIQTCTSIYMLYHCNYFQKIWYGEARWWQFQMIKGGVKNESEFCPYSFSYSKLCSFLFLSRKICYQTQILSQFFCSCEFLQEKHQENSLCSEREHGKEKSHYISNTFSLALFFPYII